MVKTSTTDYGADGGRDVLLINSDRIKSVRYIAAFPLFVFRVTTRRPCLPSWVSGIYYISWKEAISRCHSFLSQNYIYN